MKGDFSYFPADAQERWTGVLHQQGRVLLDRDWNAARQIDQRLRTWAATDAFGPGVLAVPVAEGEAFQVVQARVDGERVRVTLSPGRAWAAGVPVALAATTTLDARYLEPPLAPATGVGSLAAGVRDAVLLEVWEDSVSGFQAPADLIEPALGGPDTTERTAAFAVARLLRLGPDDDCRAVAALVDDAAKKGRLTVQPAPVLATSGDCPLEAGGGYTGLEHFLYRIEVAEPAAGQARFKWSAFNGGLVGRGVYTAGTVPGTGTVAVTANVQAIDGCGVSSFWLEALDFDEALGAWRTVFTADATRTTGGALQLANVQGSWPATAPKTAFFRLWNGIARIADFPAAAPVELQDGIQLGFDAPAAGNTNYRPGDHWCFPVRASGATFDPPLWPTAAPPHGVVVRRVALAEVRWNAALDARLDAGDIEDCRRRFRPLTNQKVCCTFNVGDGRTSFGDFDSIEEALRHLPAAGGEICLLPGLHATNAVIRNRRRVTIRGCGTQTKVTPRADAPTQPIFSVLDSTAIELLHMDLATLGGTAILVEGSKDGAVSDVLIAEHRMLACVSAVRARHVAGLVVRDNRIRMLDKAGGGPAIYIAGDDSRIERNDLRLQPFRQMPPIRVPERPEPEDPTDPCFRLEVAGAHPRVFTHYVEAVWAVALPLLPVFTIDTVPYRALGGIQVGGGSERVQVLDNTVVGGAGNGITLGAAAAPRPPEPVHSFEMTDGDARIVGRVVGPDGKAAAGVQVTLTNLTGGQSPAPQVSDANGLVGFSLARGTFQVTEGAAGVAIAGIEAVRRGNGVWTLELRLKVEQADGDVDDGFLYGIAIERNTIQAMGRSGIGVPGAAETAAAAGDDALGKAAHRALDRARALLGCPITGLVIRANRIVGNLRNPFDQAMRAEATVRGLGGISLGWVDDALIAGNRIEGNGRTATEPACGVFVQYGEDLDLHDNQVLDQGSVPDTTDVQLAPGFRGGVVLAAASSFGLMARLQGGTASTGSRPAARVHGNTVAQPVGCALAIAAYGPLQVADNAFASEFAGPSALERTAGTVLILNLGGVQGTGAGMDMKRPGSLAAEAADTTAAATAPARARSANPNLGLNQRARLQTANVAITRAPAAATLLPSGPTMFSHNQSRTGPAHAASGCQLVLSYDDVAYQGNQSYSAQDTRVFANAMVFASTLRAVGNRLAERHAQTLMSLWTLALRANDTSLNQTDHCIIATDLNPGMPEVQAGNQVLFPSALCARVNMTTAMLLKPLG